MSEIGRKMGGDDLSALDRRSALSGTPALKTAKKTSQGGSFFRSVRNLAIMGGLVYSGYFFGNYNASASKKEANEAKADLVEVNVRLDIAEKKIKEAVANSDVKAARSLYAKEILKATANNPKSHPYELISGIYDSIRKGSNVPTYVMEPIETEIGMIGNHITKMTPKNAGKNFIVVMENYASMTKFIDLNSTTEEVNQVILNLNRLEKPAQPIAKNTVKRPSAVSRQKD